MCADAAARGAADRADQRQRLRRRAAPGRGPDGDPSRRLALEASDAARLRRPCGLAPRADRVADQRHRLRARGRMPVWARSGSSSSPSSACRSSPARSRSSSCSGIGCSPAEASHDHGDFGDHARTLVDQYALDHDPDELVSRGSGLAEIVIPPRSEPDRRVMFAGMVTDSGDLVVLAIQRKGEEPRARRRSRSGTRCSSRARGGRSTTTWTTRRPGRRRPDARAAPGGPARAGASEALVVLAGMVILLATARAARGGRPARRGRDRALGRPPIEQAYRGIAWTTVILVAGMIPLSTAMARDRRGRAARRRPGRRRRRRRPPRAPARARSCSRRCSAS